MSGQSLKEQALTHPSMGMEKDGVIYNNQRLEFLGDAVLGMVVAEMLYEMYTQEQEGELARRFAGLVCGPVLEQIALSLKLDEQLILSDSEDANDGRQNSSNLEDVCEAMIGAIYLEDGFDVVKAFIYQHWKPLAESISEPPKDPKTALQEWAQARGLPVPDYKVIHQEGPSHAPRFTIQVEVQGQTPECATAGNKKQAERDAAEKLLVKLTS